ncbi:helix-turn-helix transcriptional regulator [Gracilimonas tropica]|uniref:helix-turn-helix transcriptional regulator n=1 Tax=Gracilimonas tropica TaxID=454600 RepID=UPI00035FF5B6|nr:helix-turn-helix transcriptional regulator [Gracilimonas tropica]
MISNNLKVERAKVSITQKDLAKEIGVSRQTIHSIESGKFTPSVELALKLAAFFEISVEELFTLKKG